MKKLLAFICLCIQIVPIMGQSVLRTSHGVKVETKAACVELECFSSSIIRVKKYPLGQAPEKQSLSVTMQPKKVKYKICLLYTSPSPRDMRRSRMPSSA